MSSERWGVYQKSEVEGPLEVSVSPGGSGIPQGSRGSLGRQVVPEVGGCPNRSKVLQKSGRSIREGVSPQKNGSLPERREPTEKWGLSQTWGPSVKEDPSERRRFPTEVGDSLTEAGPPTDKGVHALEAVPSEKRKPQRSPGHRKPVPRHQRRWPLTHRSCSAPPRATAESPATSGGGVRSSPLGSCGGSSLRWRPRWRQRQDDGRRTDRLRGRREARSGGGDARARTGALTPGGRSRRAALGAGARSRRSVSH